MTDPTVSAALASQALELDEKATPGPWRSMRDGNQYIKTSFMPSAVMVGASRVDGIRRPWNPHAAIAHGQSAEHHEIARFLDDDADFIAFARSALPTLAREVLRLGEENAFKDRTNKALQEMVAGEAKLQSRNAALRETIRDAEALFRDNDYSEGQNLLRQALGSGE